MSNLSIRTANVAIDESLGSLKITVSHPPNMAGFTLAIVILALRVIVALPVLSLLIIAVAWQYLPPVLAAAASILGVGLLLFLFYRGFRESLEYYYDREFIEIDNQVIRIARSGGRFKDVVEHPADNVKAITLLFPDNPKLNWMRSLPGVSSGNLDSFLIYNGLGLKRSRTFGRGIPREQARQILDTIWRRYPQYRG